VNRKNVDDIDDGVVVVEEEEEEEDAGCYESQKKRSLSDCSSLSSSTPPKRNHIATTSSSSSLGSNNSTNSFNRHIEISSPPEKKKRIQTALASAPKISEILSKKLNRTETGESEDSLTLDEMSMGGGRDDSIQNMEMQMIQLEDEVSRGDSSEQAMKKMGEWLRDQRKMEDVISTLQSEGWMT